jgi:hypothetical protein
MPSSLFVYAQKLFQVSLTCSPVNLAKARPDVTLCCNGGRKLLAHRRILAEAHFACLQSTFVIIPLFQVFRSISDTDTLAKCFWSIAILEFVCTMLHVGQLVMRDKYILCCCSDILRGDDVCASMSVSCPSGRLLWVVVSRPWPGRPDCRGGSGQDYERLLCTAFLTGRHSPYLSTCKNLQVCNIIQ